MQQEEEVADDDDPQPEPDDSEEQVEEPEGDPEPAAPEIPPELKTKAANWEVMEQILKANPALAESARAAFRQLQQGQQGQSAEPQEMTWEQAKRKAAELREAGQHEEAEELLIANHPAVREANQAVREERARRQAEDEREALREVAAHKKKYGELDEPLRERMQTFLNNKMTGGLLRVRIAALHDLGRHKEAEALRAKAPKKQAPKAVGGRSPSAQGAPAARRVAKEKGTEGSAFSQKYIEQRQREQGRTS